MRRTLIALALTGALVAGCGGDDDEPETAATPAPAAESTPAEPAAGGGGATLSVASPESGALEFDETEIEAQAGAVTVNFSNPSSTPHAFAIDGVDGAVGETVTGGEAPPLEVELEPGEYEFYCPVDGHRAAGMVGTLTVK